ncbi:MAG TPA: DUF1178 family protein [Burkholderiales bacterium]|nr:DUF1178 family protein [Burkholderiales bacterium]
MIVFDLLCASGHRFEGWFSSAEDFASQKERNLLQCPSCGSADVKRVPSPARFNLGATEPGRPAKERHVGGKRGRAGKQGRAPAKTGDMEGRDPFAIAQMLYSRMLDELLTKTEDVGKDFPEEARRIHYDQAPARPIRGVATQAEHDALVDEGIPVARFPLPPRDQLN